MQLVNTYLFNYRTNFNSFFKTERLSKLLILLFVLVTGLVVGNLVSEEFKNKSKEYELKFFFPYQIIWYFEDLFKKYLISDSSEKLLKNIFSDYRTYVYGAFFLFTLESIRLFIKYKKVTKKWNRFSLSYGVNENQKFLRVKKELVRTFGNVLAFGITLLIYLGVVLYAIISKSLKVLKGKEFDFIKHFLLKGIVFSFFVWIILTLFYFFNIKKRINKYYRNYYKKKDVNKKIDSLVTSKSFFWHLLLNLFGCFMVVLNTPIDLFIIFMSLKFIPWNNIFSKLKLITNKESNLLNLSY